MSWSNEVAQLLHQRADGGDGAAWAWIKLPGPVAFSTKPWRPSDCGPSS
jgi:hypothetical protein